MELLVDHAGHRCRLRLAAGELVMVRLDPDGRAAVGRPTIEAAEVLASLDLGDESARPATSQRQLP